MRLPAVKTDSHTEDTKIYVYYGNSNVTSSTENVDGVWDVNYVGVWHLKESGDGTAAEFVDSSGTTNHGQGGGGIPTQDTLNGQIGNAQDFDGSSDYVTMGDVLDFAYTNAISVSAWIQTNKLTGRQTIVSKQRRASPYDGWGFAIAPQALWFEYINHCCPK